MKNIIVMGPPGSGKDTQIDALQDFLDSKVIAGGDIARKLGKSDPKLMNIIREGGLIDDQVVLDKVSEELDLLDPQKGIIFDGFPRTIPQAEKLNEVMMHHNRTLDSVVYIDLEEEEVVKRLSSRKICAICGHDLPPSAEKCPQDGGRGVRREDDEPATVIKRMQTYLEKTLPLIDYYKMKGILVEINGDQPIENVTEDIKEKMGLCKKS
jgi:adenylate kinase